MPRLELSDDDALRLCMVLTSRARAKRKDYLAAVDEDRHPALISQLQEDVEWCQRVARLALEADQ
jgi:hypothetical protein